MKKSVLTIAFLIVGIISNYAQNLNDGLRALDFEKYEYARNLFKKLVVQEPANADNYYYLGQAYFNLLQNDSALAAYKNGITADAKNAKNYIGIGELNLSENKVDDAKKQFDLALSLDKGKDGKSRNIVTLQMVADAMVSTDTKLTNEALTYIQQALELDKKNYNLLITAGDVYLETPNGSGEAANNYERAIQIDTNNAKAYSKVSNIWLRVQNPEATLEALNKALAKDSNYAPALKNMAELYFMVKKYEIAKVYYTKYLKNSEESISNKIRFAQILFKTKEYEETIKKIIDIQHTDTTNIYLYRLAGYSYYEVAEAKKDTSKYRLGIASMETFFTKIALSKIIASDYEYYGKLLSKISGRENDALNNLSKALNLDSSKIEIYREIAFTYSKMKMYNEAAATYEIYISKKQPNAFDFMLLGNYYLYGGKQYGKADSAYLKVIELKPDYIPAHYYRAISNNSLDPDAKTSVAKELYEKFVSLAEPTPEKYKNNLINSYSYLGYYYIKNGDNANAKVYYNKVLAIDPENKNAKEYLKQLK